MDRRLLLTAGVRATGAAPTANTDKFFFYPKAAASYRFIRPFGGGGRDQAPRRLRPDRQPAALRGQFSPDTTGTIGGIFGMLPGNRAGDPDIEPETQTEFEGGFDAQFAGGARSSTSPSTSAPSATCCWSDLAPSTGLESRIFSSDSKLRNRGFEAALTRHAGQSRT